MGDIYTEAQKRATLKYMREKIDNISIRAKKGTKDRWKEAAKKQGKSLNKFLIDCIEKEIAIYEDRF